VLRYMSLLQNVHMVIKHGERVKWLTVDYFWSFMTAQKLWISARFKSKKPVIQNTQAF
jgi:hypothetical protein